MSRLNDAPFDRLAYARRVLRAEAASLDVVAGRLDDGFAQVADALFACRGPLGLSASGAGRAPRWRSGRHGDRFPGRQREAAGLLFAT